jgi:hypothetical protein
VATTTRARAYLMLEVGVCGALVATILLGLMTQLVDARVNTILKNRDLVAQQIANETLSATKNRAYPAITAPPAGTRVVGGARYDVVVTVREDTQSTFVQSLADIPIETAPSGTMALPFKDIRVDVSYTPQRGAVRRAIASSRAFGP